MNRSCPKRLAKDTKMIAESMKEKYVGIGLQIEFMFTAWCVKEIEKLQHFSTEPRCNWICRVKYPTVPPVL